MAELRVFGAKSLIYWQSPLTCSLHSHAIISFLIILDNATVAKMSLMPFLKIILSIAKITESPIYWKCLLLSLQFATFSCSNLDIASKNRNQKYRCTLQSRSTNCYSVVSTKHSNQPRVTLCKVPKLSRSAIGYVSSVSSELKYPGYNVYCTAYRAVPWLQSTEHSRAVNKKRSIGCQGQGHSETSLLMHTFTLILFIYI